MIHVESSWRFWSLSCCCSHCGGKYAPEYLYTLIIAIQPVDKIHNQVKQRSMSSSWHHFWGAPRAQGPRPSWPLLSSGRRWSQSLPLLPHSQEDNINPVNHRIVSDRGVCTHNVLTVHWNERPLSIFILYNSIEQVYLSFFCKPLALLHPHRALRNS